MYAQRQQNEQPLTSYIVAHPVRTRYNDILDAEAKIIRDSTLFQNGLGFPGEGRDMWMGIREAAIEMSTLEVSIVSGYFSDSDFAEVYSEYSPFNVHQEIIKELKAFGIEQFVEILLERRVVIKKICERNNWFEQERQSFIEHVDQKEFDERSADWQKEREAQLEAIAAKRNVPLGSPATATD
jgi:hypothetical protein